jgi:hypothetical protein
MRTAPRVRVACLAGFAAFCASCGPMPDARQETADLRPPRMEAARSLGPREICLTFDEAARLDAVKTRISPELPIDGIAAGGRDRDVVISCAAQTPGRRYTLETEAQDARGNSSSFIVEVYGWNGSVPRLLINEAAPRGSGSHPDIVELKALSAGDLGGVTLYLGTPGSFDGRLSFPSLRVTAGSFILVHLKPTGDPSEVNESTDIAASGGTDASASAWDFWLQDCKGLGGNNGVVSLYDRPGGSCLDGFLYSNRVSQSDERYRGFGSSEMLARAEELAAVGGWKPAGARVTPEDAVSPEGSTGTRSLCRSSASADTDGPVDWHVVPTRKATYGAENSDEVWEK